MQENFAKSSTNPAKYIFSKIDSLAAPKTTQYDLIASANLDKDPELEILYTDGTVTMSEIVRAEVTTLGCEYALHQHYPKPFNLTTSIAFDLN